MHSGNALQVPPHVAVTREPRTLITKPHSPTEAPLARRLRRSIREILVTVYRIGYRDLLFLFFAAYFRCAPMGPPWFVIPTLSS